MTPRSVGERAGPGSSRCRRWRGCGRRPSAPGRRRTGRRRSWPRRTARRRRCRCCRWGWRRRWSASARPIGCGWGRPVDRHDARLVIDGQVAALHHRVELWALQPGQRAPVEDLSVGEGDRAVGRRQAVLDGALGDAAAGTRALERVFPERLRERPHLARVVGRPAPGAITRAITPSTVTSAVSVLRMCSPNRNCQAAVLNRVTQLNSPIMPQE